MTKTNLTLQWAQTAPLDEVCRLSADVYATKKASLGGGILAVIAKRLMDVEVRPGGPYAPNGAPDLTTNLAVGYLFVILGKPLPKVSRFIKAHRHTASQQEKELLQRYDELLERLRKQAADDKASKDILYDSAKTTLRKLGEPLKSGGIAFLERVRRADTTHEIGRIATFFERSLVRPDARAPIDQLGEANIHCWISYMLYDHLIDGEASLEQLPIANVTMRIALDSYRSLFPADHPFQNVLTGTFNDMDFANAWELKHTRMQVNNDSIAITPLPDYGTFTVLAKRSFGHALGPIALAHFHGFTTQQQRLLEKGFRHYLIARQLNDDLHDWQEDLRGGRLSAVVTHMIQSEGLSTGIYQLDELVARLRVNFWNKSMEEMNAIIHRHVNLSQKYLSQSSVLEENSELMHLVARQRQVALQSSQIHEQYRDFAETYRKESKEI